MSQPKQVVIVGAGPAGLNAALIATCHGYEPVIIHDAPAGGRSRWSARIENVLGFPLGIPGKELAEMSRIQVERMGGRFIEGTVTNLYVEGGGRPAVDVRGERNMRHADAIILAPGMRYREVPALQPWESRGAFHCVGVRETDRCTGTAVVVGGADATAQAALELSAHADRVVIVTRRHEMAFAEYLQARIARAGNIESITGEVVSAEGDGRLQKVTLSTGAVIDASHAYVLAGADASLGWTGLDLDERGFIVAPQLNPRKGIWVAGDARSGSVKRVASAAGEGASAMVKAHLYLQRKH